jgi:hypothetical protein
MQIQNLSSVRRMCAMTRATVESGELDSMSPQARAAYVLGVLAMAEDLANQVEQAERRAGEVTRHHAVATSMVEKGTGGGARR